MRAVEATAGCSIFTQGSNPKGCPGLGTSVHILTLYTLRQALGAGKSHFKGWQFTSVKQPKPGLSLGGYLLLAWVLGRVGYRALWSPCPRASLGWPGKGYQTQPFSLVPLHK